MSSDNNKGKRWYKSEINQLLDEIKNNISIEQIAITHQRTVKAIKFRLLYIGNTMYKDKIEIDEILKITKVNEDELKKYIEQREKTAAKGNDIKSIQTQLTSVINKLDILTSRIEKIEKTM